VSGEGTGPFPRVFVVQLPSRFVLEPRPSTSVIVPSARRAERRIAVLLFVSWGRLWEQCPLKMNQEARTGWDFITIDDEGNVVVSNVFVRLMLTVVLSLVKQTIYIIAYLEVSYMQVRIGRRRLGTNKPPLFMASRWGSFSRVASEAEKQKHFMYVETKKVTSFETYVCIHGSRGDSLSIRALELAHVRKALN
jgi:hypothetical protein